MYTTYKEYLKQETPLPFEEAMQIWNQIAERTCCHNLVISAKNKLSVYMYEHKLGNDWDDLLGEERKRIGDFACYVVLLQGLDAR